MPRLKEKKLDLSKFKSPIKIEKTVSIEELPSHLDLNVVRVGGWWYVSIMDNILKTVVTQSKDGCSTFKEAFKNAVDQISKV